MAEKCDACKGRLEEDFISDYASMAVDQRPCGKCRGNGVLRTGPYRLADGTWSDGVDRTAWLRDWAYGRLNPNRVTVGCWSYGTDKEGREVREGFVVYRGNGRLMNGDSETFPTHAEAIAYADRMARANQGENK